MDAASPGTDDEFGMNELAALTTPSDSAAFVLPPVSDAVRDDEFVEQERRLAAAEAAIAESRWDDAVSILGESAIAPGHLPDLALRSLLAESWARMQLGELDESLKLLKVAKRVVHRPGFDELDRAHVLYRIGCLRVMRSAISRAVNDLTLALELCARSGRPCDRLRAEILEWRSRCYQHQREFAAARSDVEQALELADATGDVRAAADVNLRAAGIAEREGRWLVASCYAEKAHDLYERAGDQRSVGRVLNELGGIAFSLGRHEDAIGYLKQAVAVLVDAAGDNETGTAVASLARMYLRTGEPELAAEHARTALELLDGGDDVADEFGNVQLVLGQALLEAGQMDDAEECFVAAESTFSRSNSVGLLAAAWMAQGELAAVRDDFVGATELYRRAAEALQDSHL